MRNLHSWSIFPQNFGSATSRSLAILFTLQEYLRSRGLLKTLEKTPLLEIDAKEHIDLWLFSSLNNPLTQREGALDKLCFYTQIMLKTFKSEDKKIPDLLEKMREAIIRVRDHLTSLAELSKELQQTFHEFFLALLPFLQGLRTDENVLLYLIEHHETFNLYLGKRSIETLLQTFFPSGIHELRATLCEGYTRRGFSDFYAGKEHLLDALEWTPSRCNTP